MDTRAKKAARWMVAMTIAVSGVANASLELQGRDINGNAVAGNDASAVFLYDSVLNLTWLRNANANGPKGWAEANAWASSLTVGVYGGWRLPTIKPLNGTTFTYQFSNNGSTEYGFGASGNGWGMASEMGHLWYFTLGNKGFCTPGAGGPTGCEEQPGWGLTNKGDFKNLQSGDYWSGTEYEPGSPDQAWYFRADRGSQLNSTKTFSMSAFAVRPGDVLSGGSPAVVPLPASLPLILAGLGSLDLRPDVARLLRGLVAHHSQGVLSGWWPGTSTCLSTGQCWI